MYLMLCSNSLKKVQQVHQKRFKVKALRNSVLSFTLWFRYFSVNNFSTFSVDFNKILHLLIPLLTFEKNNGLSRITMFGSGEVKRAQDSLEKGKTLSIII